MLQEKLSCDTGGLSSSSKHDSDGKQIHPARVTSSWNVDKLDDLIQEEICLGVRIRKKTLVGFMRKRPAGGEI